MKTPESKRELPLVRLYYTVPELAALAGRSRHEIRRRLIDAGLIPRHNARRKNIILLADIRAKCPMLWASIAEVQEEKDLGGLLDFE